MDKNNILIKTRQAIDAILHLWKFDKFDFYTTLFYFISSVLVIYLIIRYMNPYLNIFFIIIPVLTFIIIPKIKPSTIVVRNKLKLTFMFLYPILLMGILICTLIELNTYVFFHIILFFISLCNIIFTIYFLRYIRNYTKFINLSKKYRYGAILFGLGLFNIVFYLINNTIIKHSSPSSELGLLIVSSQFYIAVSFFLFIYLAYIFLIKNKEASPFQTLHFRCLNLAAKDIKDGSFILFKNTSFEKLHRSSRLFEIDFSSFNEWFKNEYNSNISKISILHYDMWYRTNPFNKVEDKLYFIIPTPYSNEPHFITPLSFTVTYMSVDKEKEIIPKTKRFNFIIEFKSLNNQLYCSGVQFNPSSSINLSFINSEKDAKLHQIQDAFFSNILHVLVNLYFFNLSSVQLNYDVLDYSTSQARFIAHCNSFGSGKTTFAYNFTFNKNYTPIVISPWEENITNDFLYQLFLKIKVITKTKYLCCMACKTFPVLLLILFSTLLIFDPLITIIETLIPNDIDIQRIHPFLLNISVYESKVPVYIFFILLIIFVSIYPLFVDKILSYKNLISTTYKKELIKEIIKMLSNNNNLFIVIEDLDRLKDTELHQVVKDISYLNNALNNSVSRKNPFGIISYDKNIIKRDSFTALAIDNFDKIAVHSEQFNGYSSLESMIQYRDNCIALIKEVTNDNTPLEFPEIGQETSFRSLSIAFNEIVSEIIKNREITNNSQEK